MGASGWNYFVPYQADISAALQRLREDVFARGDYVYGDGITGEDFQAAFKVCGGDLESTIQRFAEQAEYPNLPDQTKAKLLALVDRLKALRVGGSGLSEPKPKPNAIEDLLELQAETGTHSILDISSVSPQSGFAAVSPFLRSKLVEFFGSDTPTHAQIEEAYEFGSLEEFVSEPWQGIYIVVYRDGKTDEIFFAGCSGD